MAPPTRSRGGGKGHKRAREPAKKTTGGEGKGKVRLEQLNPLLTDMNKRMVMVVLMDLMAMIMMTSLNLVFEFLFLCCICYSNYLNFLFSFYKDRIVHMDKCSAMKKKLETESKSRLEALNTFFKKKGIPSYEEALRQLIEGNIKPSATKAAIARKIAKYAEFRLINTNRILLELLDVEPWDQIYVAFLADLMNHLKEDIVLSAPELDAMRAFRDVFLSATERSQVYMSPPMRELVHTWLRNSMSENDMMRKWSKCPDWLIDTSLHDRSVLPSDFFFGDYPSGFY